MKTNVREAIIEIRKQSVNIVINNAKIEELYSYIDKKYNIPGNLVFDMLFGNKANNKFSRFEVFAVMDGICHVDDSIENDLVNKYFTDQEIEAFKNEKFEIDTLEFPLVFDAIKISDDQWITKITVRDLMKMRFKRFITYNANTQRQLKKVVKNGEAVYQISINQKAVKSIEKALKNNSFIANTLTFNLPEDALFTYDEEKKQLIIEKASGVDIVDGYHRYLAACKVFDNNHDFDFTFELRIIHFDEFRAKEFIFQEDQKTQMKRIASVAYDMNRASNQVIGRVNKNPMCNLYGMLSINSGFCDIGVASNLIDSLIFKGKKLDQAELNVEIVKASRSLSNYLNMVTDAIPEFLQSKVNDRQLAVVMYFFKEYYEKEGMSPEDLRHMVKLIEYAVKHVDEMKGNNAFKTGKIGITAVKVIDKFIKECLDYV